MIPVQRMVMVGGEVAFVTLAIVLGAVFGGIWMDKAFGTGWIVTILLVVLSAPLSIALTFWLAMRAVRDLNPPSQGGAKPGGSSPQAKIQDEEGGNDW
jgi:predicted MFS family arabinose efflux permease